MTVAVLTRLALANRPHVLECSFVQTYRLSRRLGMTPCTALTFALRA